MKISVNSVINTTEHCVSQCVCHAGVTDDLSMRVLCFDMCTNHFLDRITDGFVCVKTIDSTSVFTQLQQQSTNDWKYILTIKLAFNYHCILK